MKNSLILLFVILLSICLFVYGNIKLDFNQHKLAPMEDFKAILYIVLGIFIPIIYLLFNYVN